MENQEITQTFKWTTGYTIVTDSYISVAKKVIQDEQVEVKPKEYNVFSKERLYEEFSDIEKIEQVYAFVKSYGALGIEIEKKETELQDIVNILTYSPQTFDIDSYKKITLALHEMKKEVFFENTDDFLKEAKLMRDILKLNSYQQIKVTDMQDIKVIMDNISDLCNIEFSYNIDKPIADFKLLEYAAKALTLTVVNLKMKNVSKTLGADYSESKKTFVYFDSWLPKSLLGCLYTMLYTDLIGGAKTAICRYCLKPFVVLDNRNKERHKACRIAYNTQQSRNRKRFAIQLHQNGLSVERIYEQLNQGEKTSYTKVIKKDQIKKWIGGK